MPTVHIPDDVVSRPFGQETVLLNLTTGHYHGLNHSGGRMLEVLREVPDMDAAARRVAEEFSADVDEVRRDLAELCAALAERALVRIDPGGNSVPPAPGG